MIRLHALGWTAQGLTALLVAACQVSAITPPPELLFTDTPGNPTPLIAISGGASTEVSTRTPETGATSILAIEAVPSPMVEGLGPILFHDMFDSNTAWGEGPEEFGTIIVSGGTLNISLTMPHRYMLSRANRPPVDDAYYEVTARASLCAGGDEYALLFHLTDLQNYYRFSLRCDGYAQVSKVAGGTSQPLKDWTLTAAFTPGAPAENRLGAWVRDGQLHMYVNGMQLFTLTDRTFISGGPGLFVRSSDSGNASVSFDELTVWELVP